MKKRGRPKIPVRPVSNGPPPREIILDDVLYWMELQATCEEIAGQFRVSESTLVRTLHEHFGMNFDDLYKRVGGAGKLSLRRYQFNQAKKSATMAIWLGKQWLNQRDEEKNTTEFPNDTKLDELIKAVKEKKNE